MISSDKPVKLSLTNYLIRKLSVKKMLPEDAVSKIVNHQFKYLNEVLLYNNSVEISGFGKFLFKPVAARRQLISMLNVREAYLKKEQTEKMVKKLESVNEYIKYLKYKLNEL